LEAIVGKDGASTVAGSCWPSLKAEVHRLDKVGQWLLVVDDLLQPSGAVRNGMNLEEQEGLVFALGKLLDSSARVCLLINARLPVDAAVHLTSLSTAKVISMDLPPLPPANALELFKRRLRRPLYPCDLEVGAQGWKQGAQPLVIGLTRTQQQSRQTTGPHQVDALLVHLAAFLQPFGGLPGRIVEVASQVDFGLPSLLQHPCLASGRPPVRTSAGGFDMNKGIATAVSLDTLPIAREVVKAEGATEDADSLTSSLLETQSTSPLMDMD